MSKESTKETAQARTAVAADAAQRLNTEDVIDLKELFWFLIVRWKAIILAVLVGALLFGAYHRFLLKPSYEADASIFITTDDALISVSGLQISSQLTEDYAKIIKSRTVLKQVIKDLELDMSFNDLGNLVSVDTASDSHIITITVTYGDAELSRNIANSVMNNGVSRIYQVIGNSEPTVIDYSESDSVVEVTPSLLRYLAIGGLLGMCLVCGLLILWFLTDTTLKSEDDIQKYLHIPVLCVVPYFEEGKE